MRHDKTGDRSPRLTRFAVRYRGNGTVRFERHHRSRSAIFDIELAKNMFDVLADGAGLCAENNSDIVVTFAPGNPEENLGHGRWHYRALTQHQWYQQYSRRTRRPGAQRHRFGKDSRRGYCAPG